jgi:AcrR family transcriptional regulator
MSANTAPQSASGRLSREQIVSVAARLLEQDGLSGLSMRRLAEQLEVSAMTPYRYFRDKDELLDAVVDAWASEDPLPDPPGEWDERVREMMRWLWVELSRYPALVRLRLERPFLSPGALRLTEAVLGALLDAGFTRAEALRAYRTLLVHTFGSAAFGSHSGTEEVRRRTGAALAALPAEQYPILTSSITEAAETANEGPFEYGLDCLLEGLKAFLALKGKTTSEQPGQP